MLKVIITIIIAFLIWCVVGFVSILIAERKRLIRGDLSNSEVVNFSMAGLVTTIIVILLAVEKLVNDSNWKITKFVNKKNDS